VAGYCVYALWTVAEYLHIWMAGNSYFEELSKTMGAEFAQEFSRLLPWWSVFPMIILTVVVAWIGTLIGKGMMKKHFDRIDINEYEYN
jgi:energy-coupling factor transport system substrate-specific component